MRLPLYHCKRIFNSRTDDKDAVFVSERAPHDRLSTNAIRKILHKLSDKSGVDNVFPHSIY